jgi:hypothetical protein
MIHTLFYDDPSVLTCILLVVTMLLFVRIGISMAERKRRKNYIKGEDGFGPIEASLLGLVAFLIGFTFSMALSRYEARREVMISECNMIGTAILRTDLYPDSLKQLFRADFKDYVNSRIAYYECGSNNTEIQNSLKQCSEISSRIWKRALAFSSKLNSPFVISNQMIPALNQMIDIVTTRDDEMNFHIPDSIIVFLFILCLVGSFVIGYSMHRSKLDWLILVSFCLMISISFYMILDLDKPTMGLIHLNDPQQKMIELLHLFDK